MTSTATLKTTVPQIAGLIEQDIRRRGLPAGSQYLTAEEVARTFAVHPRAASRAMKQLAQRGVLERKRGVGTFVGAEMQSGERVEFPLLHVLAGATMDRSARRIGGLIEGLAAAGFGETDSGPENSGGGESVQLDFLPAENPAAHVRALLQSGRARPPRGAVLVHCDRDVQQAVLESGVPAVVFGSVHADLARLASVDLDQREIGHLFVRYARRIGANRLAVLTRETWLPGDNHMVDGLYEEVAVGGNGIRVLLRSLPSDGNAVAREVHRLLESPDRPEAILCRSAAYTNAALRVAGQLGLRVPEDLQVVVDTLDRQSADDGLNLPHICSPLPYTEQSRRAGELLERIRRGEEPETRHVCLPVELIEMP